MITVKLKRGCYVNEWSGRSDRDVWHRKGDEFEVDPNNIVDDCYEIDADEWGTMYVPVNCCVEVSD